MNQKLLMNKKYFLVLISGIFLFSCTGMNATKDTGPINTSTGVISGTESSSITQATTYSNIQVTLTDGQSQATTKTFSITISVGATGGGQFN